jgi:hypothetical protein
MKKRYSTNYTPAFSHPIATAMLFILTLTSLMVIVISTTTFVRYGYMLPPLFHLFPIMLIVLLRTKIRLKQIEQGTYDYTMHVCGMTILSKTFDSVSVAQRGKLYTLIGHDKNGAKTSTYITESAAIAHLVFSHFGSPNTPSVT